MKATLGSLEEMLGVSVKLEELLDKLELRFLNCALFGPEGTTGGGTKGLLGGVL